ncbi:MAG: 3-oxoacyl-[acyl-carrier protein] reductase [Bacteroidia bacterium]|jgi:3-oxoacyl-[acyl-carrier protein] reductase
MECALITGGSRGIGRATALQLGKNHNLHILINYASNDEDAIASRDYLSEQGCSVELLKFKVQDGVEVSRVLTKWEEENPDNFIKVLVNNAGTHKDGLFLWSTPEQWDEVISVSLKGMYNVTKFCVDRMLKQKRGRIINMSSISGVSGNAGQVNYSAAKAGMVGATKALAKELARMKITVNAVAPGFIETEMTDDLDKKATAKKIPMGRFGKSEEVASLISYLVSDQAGYITGEVININGGLYS